MKRVLIVRADCGVCLLSDFVTDPALKGVDHREQYNGIIAELRSHRVDVSDLLVTCLYLTFL